MKLYRFLLSGLGLICILTSTENVAAQAPPPFVSAQNALVLDLQSSKTLFEKSPETPVSVASLTKLALALVSMEQLPLEETTIISQKAAAMEGSTAFLEAGETFLIKNLLFALLISSGNDVAIALAEELTGSQEQTVDLLNQKAKELGLMNTHFMNATGLDQHGHYSTALDLAQLAQILLHKPLFREIIKTSSFNLQSQAGVSRQLYNTNHLLGQTIGPFTVTGMKTGTTLNAGQCLIVLAEDPEHKEYLIVLLRSQDRYQDAKTLLQWLTENSPVTKGTPQLSDWPFPDLESYKPFFETVLNFKKEGLLKGDDGTQRLRGKDALNRAELVTFLLRSQGYTTPDSLKECSPAPNPSFSDVPLGEWYSPAVECAKDLGWITGDDLPLGAGQNERPRFRPAEAVNVVEALKMISKTQNLPEAVNTFQELWYQPYVEEFKERKILKGLSQEQNYQFAYTHEILGSPSDPLARAAAFELLARVRQSQFSTEEDKVYQPYLSLSEYQTRGDEVIFDDQKMRIKDPFLGFELTDLPLGNFNPENLKVFIQNPSGQSQDYYTIWSLIYPDPEAPLFSEGKILFSILLYDPDYLKAGFKPVIDDPFLPQTPLFQWNCHISFEGLNPDHISLYYQICPQVGLSPFIDLKAL